MHTDKELAQILRIIPLIISKAFFVFFLALYYDRSRINIKQEPETDFVDFWIGSGLMCHIPDWRILRYSYVKDHVHYILRPDPIPKDVPGMIRQILSGDYDHGTDFYYGPKFDLPDYIKVPYSGPDTPFNPAKVDSEHLLREESCRIIKENRLRIA